MYKSRDDVTDEQRAWRTRRWNGGYVKDDGHGVNRFTFYFFNFFFWDDAAALLPNMNADVCLSAPVDFEMEVELAKVICKRDIEDVGRDKEKDMPPTNPIHQL
jgi:hypothetical protein